MFSRLLTIALLTGLGAAQPLPVNYDESKVGTYTLPDPLVLQNGRRVTTAATWTKQRHPEILHLFETNVYGRTVAGRPSAMTFELVDIEKKALNGTAIRKQVAIYFTGK